MTSDQNGSLQNINSTSTAAFDPFNSAHANWRDALKNLLFLTIVIGLIFAFSRYVGFDNLQNTVEKAGVFAPLVIVLLKATTIVVVPLGGMPLYPISGALFGFWKGLAITLLGDALGSTIAFYLSRFFGQKVFHFVMPKKYLAITDRLTVTLSDIKTFAKVRLFFTGIPELFAYAAGLTGISFFIFLPIHVGVHAISAALFVAFGNLIISGNVAAITIGTVTSTSLILAGMWWLHKHLQNESMPSTASPTVKIIHSAGGVVVGLNGAVIVVSQHGLSWSLPKGHIDPGEDALTAAKREIFEESGVRDLELIKKFPVYTRDPIQGGIKNRGPEIKHMHMFLFTTNEFELKPVDPDNPEARWVLPHEVTQFLTNPKDKEFYTSILPEIEKLTKKSSSIM